MNEIHMTLSGDALQALPQGAELVLDLDDTRLYLSCDSETVESFQRAVQRALLHLLPAGEAKH